MSQHEKKITAFVLAGGGSLGAVQVGMLAALSQGGIVPDFVVGASVGAINAAYYAAEPDDRGVERLKRIWLRLRRTDVFPFSLIASFRACFGRADHVVAPAQLQKLIESALPYQRLEETRLPAMSWRPMRCKEQMSFCPLVPLRRRSSPVLQSPASSRQ